MKKELLIFGLQNSETACKDVATNFFEEKMQIDEIPEIQFAHWKGKGENCPLLVRFVHANAKGKIFVKATNLKDLKNHQDKSYRLSDNLPEEMAEKQHRNVQVLRSNKLLVMADHQEMAIKKQQLTINGQPYKKKIATPDVELMMDFTEDT